MPQAASATPQRASRSVPITFGAPAGLRPAGPLRPGDPFTSILPSGRLVQPIGASVVVGSGALGVALTPNDRFAILSNGEGDSGHAELVVVDARSMTVVDRYEAPKPDTFFAGIAATKDPETPGNTLVLASGGASNAVYAFDLDASGHLSPDAKPAIAMPPPADERLANFGRAIPSSIVVSRDGNRAFVVNNGGDDVATIDLATRAVLDASTPVGYAPFGAAVTRNKLLVANEGLMAYGVLATASNAPIFGPPQFQTGRSSSLTILPIERDGLSAATGTSVQMDTAPDGMRTVGGAHPSAVVATPNGKYAFVAMTNVDRIATVALTGTPRVTGGTELRLYDRGPYGTQPDALALNGDGSRLYAALAGINAVAVLDARDPRRVHRLGLLPTGWGPTALALSRDGRRLFVANARGAVWPGGAQSTLQRIDLGYAKLRSTTRQTLSFERTVGRVRVNPVVPQILGSAASAVVKHVVLVLAGNRTFDAMLGDLGSDVPDASSAGDPSLVQFGASVTPNLHALARTFALAANLYSDAGVPGTGDAVASAGIQSIFTERLHAAGAGRLWPGGAGSDPEDYPRLGYIFNSLATHHQTYRDYGALLRVSGSVPGGTYSLDVPALAALDGNVDLRYEGYDPRVRNVQRADEFVRDYASVQPDFASVWLPSTTSGSDDAAMADQDRALGKIIDFLTHRPEWESTAVFVMPDGVQASRDHIEAMRSYALVVSPYAKRGYVGMRHLSTASVLKTEEELLGLPALSLGDALASDMSEFFDRVPNAAPFGAVTDGG
jgi:YVTN family beta-propeller protein